MRLVPSNMNLFDGFFDDMFGDSFFRNRSSAVMKTDIKEKDGNYLLNIELPGYQKEDLNISLERGYLTIQASHNTDNSEKDDEGRIVRRERSFGSCSRSFYVGDKITEEDIKANYQNGELKIMIPNKEEKELPSKKTIMID